VIRVGVAGWDYADWDGTGYPARSGRGFDRLAYLSRYVDLIEINSTFYRPVAPRVAEVAPRVAESWVRRTAGAEGFVFTAKAHRSWTHDADADVAAAVPETLSGLRPLLDAGKLGAVLLQFPQSFHFTDSARERIDRLVTRLGDWPAVVEVRHVSWGTEEAGRWLCDRGVGWCAVDQPRVGNSTLPTVPRVIGDVGYLRLHGRNVANWFRSDAGRDARYDYLYSEEQIRELLAPVRQMADQVAHLFVVQNNHFRGKALVNTLQMKAMLESTTPSAPEPLVATYPELAPFVRVKRTRLF